MIGRVYREQVSEAIGLLLRSSSSARAKTRLLSAKLLLLNRNLQREISLKPQITIRLTLLGLPR